MGRELGNCHKAIHQIDPFSLFLVPDLANQTRLNLILQEQQLDLEAVELGLPSSMVEPLDLLEPTGATLRPLSGRSRKPTSFFSPY